MKYLKIFIEYVVDPFSSFILKYTSHSIYKLGEKTNIFSLLVSALLTVLVFLFLG